MDTEEVEGSPSISIPKILNTLMYLFSIVASISFAIYGLRLLITDFSFTISFKASSIFDFSFGGDALSGFFILLISILSIPVSFYSIGYTKHINNKLLMAFLFNLFILSMYAVILSQNIITFLVFWETMSILSYFLVIFERDEKSVKAGLVYAVMTHIGTAFIIVLFLLLYYYSGSMSFSDIKASSLNIPIEIKNIVFIFALIGFGTKAGIIPLHTWLPRAHPTAPSNISSLMSGVMIKTGGLWLYKGMHGYARWWSRMVGHNGANSGSRIRCVGCDIRSYGK